MAKNQRDCRLRDSRPADRRPKSPHWSTRNKRAGSSSRSNSRGRRGHSDSRSGFASVNFHITGPSNSTCLIDTGAQRSCIGQQTFVNLGGNLKSWSKSENSYIFGDSKPSPSLGKDVVSQDVPGLIEMVILNSKDRDRSMYLSTRYLRKTADSGQCQD